MNNAAVMLSIRPKWCELIASGKKTIEVRKTRPKLKTPFKCYIYQTLGRMYWADIPIPKDQGGGDIYDKIREGGKVIGEFTCDRVSTYDYAPDCSELADPEDMMYYITTEEADCVMPR